MMIQARLFGMGGAAFALLAASPIHAQASAPIENRVNRLEQEMRAVQRKVFPGGAGQILQPDVTAPTPVTGTVGTPASSPLDDLTTRVSAIESQLTRMTGQIEQTEFRVKQLEAAFAAAQAKPPEPAVAAPPVATITPSLAPSSSSASVARLPTRQPRQVVAAATPTADSARLQAVAAVDRPSTGDAALDGYTYGYRLWAAKFFPEAQVQLRSVLEKHGSGPVGSRAQNLLGRALLDDGNAAAAAKTLYENYRLRPNGDRAAESLAWVGEALIQLKQLSNACLAYDELDTRFGADLPSGVRAMVTKGRLRAKCGA